MKPVLESIRKATPDARVVFICNSDDEEEKQAILDADPLVKTMLVDGNWAAKLNEGVRQTTEPLLFFGADDLDFHPGWFEAAKEVMALPGVGVVATNDLCNGMVQAGQLATHPLVTREYAELGTIDDPSRALHESYPHEYVDREFSETAMRRGAFAYAPEAVVEHLHPLVDKAPWDELYSNMRPRMRRGVRIYWRRRKLWK